MNWIILPLISFLYYLIFFSVTAHRGVTEGVLSAVCLMLVTDYRIQAIRVFVPLSQSPQFNNLGHGNKFIFWSWVANHVVYLVVEVLLIIDYWVGYRVSLASQFLCLIFLQHSKPSVLYIMRNYC